MKPIIFDTSDGQNLRINMISPWLKKHFGCKIIKLALDGGFTCPNRDGSKGYGGCLFCSESGSGDMASSGFNADSIHKALDEQIKLLESKWPEAKYIAYFQSHTNTYAEVSELREKFEAALNHPGVIGLAIATRSDCIPEDVLELLDELNKKTFLWVEIGLQTAFDSTAEAMNLCHDLADYDDAIKRLASRNIRTVSHLILGLPGETEDMMMQSIKHACMPINSAGDHIFGIKLHMMNVVRGSLLPEKYPDFVPFETMEEYVDLLIRAVEIIPPDITVHRISGDAPRSTLISPEWSFKKRTILNTIHNTMRADNTWQGRKC